MGGKLDSRERLIAACRGGPTDRIPWFAWCPEAEAEDAVSFYNSWQPDALVINNAEQVAIVREQCPVPVLVEVGNPFGFAMLAGVDLTAEFDKSPRSGEAAFGDYARMSREALDSALEAGADGILYRLFGAEPSLSTPMQFGGFYLEQERDLMSGVAEALFNVLYVEGGEGTYLDVVSDLPAHAFGWDETRCDVHPADVHKMRIGALACGIDSPDPQRLLRDLGGSGLILSGKVDDLDRDFSDVVSASQSLVEHAL